MAICYKNGFGCEQNEKKAFEFMEKAANLGLVDGNFFQFNFFESKLKQFMIWQFGIKQELDAKKISL